jgi:hypothetical protein
LFDEQGKDVLQVEKVEAVDVRIMQKKISALSVCQPADKTLRIFSLQGGEKRRRPQNVPLSPALDDQDFGGERLEVRARLAWPPEDTGLIPSKMDALGFKSQT